MRGFMMNLAIAERFFKLCRKLHLNTEKERLNLMNKLIHKENIKILNKKQFLEQTKGKKILIYKGKYL